MQLLTAASCLSSASSYLIHGGLALAHYFLKSFWTDTPAVRVWNQQIGESATQRLEVH